MDSQLLRKAWSRNIDLTLTFARGYLGSNFLSDKAIELTEDYDGLGLHLSTEEVDLHQASKSRSSHTLVIALGVALLLCRPTDSLVE